MQPIILLIRHSNTTYDKKVDALLDPPLDEEGMERLRRTIAFLDASPYKPERIVSSPLQRAVKVAAMISRGNAQVTTHNEALPWNLGDYMGKLSATVEPFIQQLQDYPDLKAPHGESYRTFFNRWEAFLGRVMQYAQARPASPIFITTHSRNIDALSAILGQVSIGEIPIQAPEASVTLLSKSEDGDWIFDRIWDGK
jgi:broad specificity phosphatase PhoE